MCIQPISRPSQEINRHIDEHSASAESRRHIGLCLRNAFAVGDLGSFSSLIEAIGDDTGNP